MRPPPRRRRRTPAPRPLPRTARPDSQDVEDIVVFGRKRPETVFRSPEAVTALAPLQLTQQSISQLTDLSRVAPNVIVRQSTGGSGDIQVVIRGQIIAVSNPSNDAPIGIYFDGRLCRGSKGLTGSVFDLDSVEVSSRRAGARSAAGTTPAARSASIPPSRFSARRRRRSAAATGRTTCTANRRS
ncbi:MAG: TonB-dependent receptor plug domain-containing protein [Sphingomonas sp.]